MKRSRSGVGGLCLIALTVSACVCGCETVVVHRRPVPPPRPHVVSVEPVEYVPYVPIHQRVSVNPVREFHKDPRVDYRKPPKNVRKPAPKKVASPKPVRKSAPPKKGAAPKPRR